MSCTVMYQPYAMSSYSAASLGCDGNRAGNNDKQKLSSSYKFPTAPSPTDSLHSDTSSYHHNSSSSPGVGGGGSGGGGGGGGGGRLSVATISSTSSSASSSRRPITPTATITSSQHHHQQHQQQHQQQRASSSSSSSSTGLNGSAAATSTLSSGRTEFLAPNCVVHSEHEDVARAVDEHFSRSLSAAYANDKTSSKGKPMSRRELPLSFWNSNYQQSKASVATGVGAYGAATSAAAAADYYGTAMADYPTPIPGLSAHHHQADPWHYPLTSHQSYHHRPAEIPYTSMPSTSRFNAAQYGSLFLAGAAAAGSSAGRFGSMATSSQKSEPSSWATGRYHHHEALSDLHLDYTTAAAAAAHYSNMTAGLETTVQDSSKDLYWF